MKVDPDKPIDLLCTWRGDRVRKFDILVSGKKIAAVDIGKLSKDRFHEVSFAIPGKLTAGKKKIRVRFQSRKGQHVARLFGCKTVLRKSAE